MAVSGQDPLRAVLRDVSGGPPLNTATATMPYMRTVPGTEAAWTPPLDTANRVAQACRWVPATHHPWATMPCFHYLASPTTGKITVTASVKRAVSNAERVREGADQQNEDNAEGTST